MPEKDIAFLRNQYEKEKTNFDKCLNNEVAGQRVTLFGGPCFLNSTALMAYVLDNDIRQFRIYAAKAPDWAINAFDLKKSGEHIKDAYVTIGCLFHIHTGLAGGNFKGVLDLARAMGNDRKLDQRESHVDNRRYGYFLKAFLTNDAEGLAEWLPVIEEKFIAKGKGFHYGECLVLKAILEKNLEMAQQGLAAMVRFHKNSTRWNKVDCHLCLEGVGLANLCRWKGLWVEGIEPLIPNDLLMNEEEIKEAIAALPLQGG